MTFKQFKQVFDSAVKRFNNLFSFAKRKVEVGEEFKNKLLKIAYLIIEVLEEVEGEVEESQEEVEEILEE